MEFVTKCLVTASQDAGENDKLVTVLTEDRGIIRAKLRGVKKAAAKFKFAAQPFCFAECVVHEKNGYYTIVSAAAIDSFFNILTDFDKMNAGFIVLEAAEKFELGSVGCELTEALKGLGGVCYGNRPYLAAAIFVSRLLVRSGYRLELENCISCGRPAAGGDRTVISLSGGGVKCRDCADGGDGTIRMENRDMLLRIRGADYDADCGVSENQARSALRIYAKMISVFTGEKMNSVK